MSLQIIMWVWIFCTIAIIACFIGAAGGRS